MGFYSELKKWFGDFKRFVTSEQAATTTIKLAASALELIVADTAGEADSALITSAINEAQTDFGIAATLLSAPGGAAGNVAQITAALSSVQTNLPALLSAGHIKDPVTLTKVTAAVTGVIEDVEAILADLPKAAAPAPAAL
jgi:hypothetical protein